MSSVTGTIDTCTYSSYNANLVAVINQAHIVNHYVALDRLCAWDKTDEYFIKTHKHITPNNNLPSKDKITDNCSNIMLNDEVNKEDSIGPEEDSGDE